MTKMKGFRVKRTAQTQIIPVLLILCLFFLGSISYSGFKGLASISTFGRSFEATTSDSSVSFNPQSHFGTFPTVSADSLQIASSGGIIPLARQVIVSQLPSGSLSQSIAIAPEKHVNETNYNQVKSQAVSVSVLKPLVTTSPGSNSQPLYALTGFDGIAGTATSCNCAPPDVELATGPSDVVEMVNLQASIWTTSGSFVKTFSLSSFYGTADSLSDPKILYDSSSGRWFTSLLDVSADLVFIGTSKTSDPTGAFYIYSLPTVSPDLPDQPILGVSNDKVAASVNLFSTTSFLGAQYWIINKAELMSGSSASYSTPGVMSSYISIHSVQALSSTSTLYLVTVGGVSGGNYNNPTTSVTLFSVTGVPGVSTVSSSSHTLTVNSISIPPGALNHGNTFPVDTSDYRPQDAKWILGNLYLSLDDGCTPSGDSTARSCVRVIEINTGGTPSISQDFDFSHSGDYFYYPALSIDVKGDLDIVYGYSSSSIYPSVAITAETAGSSNTVSSISPILKSGTATLPCIEDSFGTPCRFGDYFEAALDPSNPDVVWVAGEYAGSDSLWNTFIASMTDCLCLNLNPSSGPNGQVVQVTGTGFSASSHITLTYDGSGVSTTPASVSSNLVGTFTATFTVPSTSPSGPDTVSGTDASSHSASTTYTDTTISVPDLPLGNFGVIVAIMIALTSYGLMRVRLERKRKERS
jgi:hypothetical protein